MIATAKLYYAITINPVKKSCKKKTVRSANRVPVDVDERRQRPIDNLVNGKQKDNWKVRVGSSVILKIYYFFCFLISNRGFDKKRRKMYYNKLRIFVKIYKKNALDSFVIPYICVDIL